MQRSCGYALRPTLSIDDIAAAVAALKEQRPDVLVLVDNCYGEFTDTQEPPAVSQHGVGCVHGHGSALTFCGRSCAPCVLQFWELAGTHSTASRRASPEQGEERGGGAVRWCEYRTIFADC